MANSFEIKKILEDIVFYAYKDTVDEQTFHKMQKFFVKLENRVVKSYHGYYNRSCITIVNLNRDETNIICTCIHELAHHVDACIRLKTDHSQDFYDVFGKLLYTGLNMGLFEANNARNMETDASDSNKICRIIDKYIPNPIEYRKEERKIVVRGGYAIREALSKAEFYYDGLAKTWEKIVPLLEVPEYEKILQSVGCVYSIEDAKEMKIDAVGVLVATKGSYEHRQELSSAGFYYKDKKWKKKISMKNYEKEMQALEHLKGQVLIKLERKK